MFKITRGTLCGESLYTIEKSETEKIKLWETAAQYAMEAIQLSGTSLPAMKADFFEKPDHAEILWRNYQEDYQYS